MTHYGKIQHSMQQFGRNGVEQYAVTRYDVGTVWCDMNDMVLHDWKLYGMYDMEQYGNAWYGTVWYSAEWYNAALCGTV